MACSYLGERLFCARITAPVTPAVATAVGAVGGVGALQAAEEMFYGGGGGVSRGGVEGLVEGIRAGSRGRWSHKTPESAGWHHYNMHSHRQHNKNTKCSLHIQLFISSNKPSTWCLGATAVIDAATAVVAQVVVGVEEVCWWSRQRCEQFRHAVGRDVEVMLSVED